MSPPSQMILRPRSFAVLPPIEDGHIKHLTVTAAFSGPLAHSQEATVCRYVNPVFLSVGRKLTNASGESTRR